MMEHHSISMLPMLLNVLRKKMMEEHRILLESYGLTQKHLDYLMLLNCHKSGLAQKDIVERIHLDKAHASRSLRELVEKGILSKEDKKGYNNKYFLSNFGLEVSEKIKSQSLRIHQEVFSVLSEEEREQIEKIAKKLSDHILDK